MTTELNARQQILARLRSAPHSTTQPAPDVAAWYQQHTRQETPAQQVQRLRAALEASHAEVHDVSAENWMSVLLRVAAEKGWRQLLIGSDTVNGEALAAGNDSPDLQIVRYEQPMDSWKDRLFDDIDAALTLARSAIAETGSLILWPDTHEPRLMSLVPPVHVVLLDVANIHADFYSAMRAEGWQQGLPTNALLISGPSKTADIQQTLAYGAHGPRELVVLLRHGQGAAA